MIEIIVVTVMAAMLAVLLVTRLTGVAGLLKERSQSARACTMGAGAE